MNDKRVFVYIHYGFGISASILLLSYTDSPFRLSLFIFLRRGKRTYSQTTEALSVLILHIPLLHELLLHTPDAFKSNFTPCYSKE